MIIAERPSISPKIFFASSTAAKLTDTALRAISVSVRTCLANRERLLEQAVEDHADGSGLAGVLVGVLDLPEDLRLADDQRVQARGDAEEVAHRVGPGVQVQVRGQFALGHLVVGGDESPHRRRALLAAFDDRRDLNAVAGREDHRLARTPAAPCSARSASWIVLSGNATLADVHRGGLVVQPDDDDVHQPVLGPAGLLLAD
jgi:hypothetical protein